MTDIFETLDKKKLSTELYPTETIWFLKDLLSSIGETFDPYKKFNDQFLWKTKSQYEVMLNYIYTKFTDIEKLRDEDGSVKFILSKVLESTIFKNLEIIYFYNLYNDPEKRSIRTQLERALDHIYQCNFLSETYILDKEISKIVIDWVIITSPNEIKKALQTTMKKNRYVYSIKTNEEFNKVSKNKIRDVYENLESISLEKPLSEVLILNEIKFTTSKDYKTIFTDNKDKLISLLLDDSSYYISRNWVLRQNTNNKKIIVNLDFSKLEYLNGKLYDKSLNISLSLNPTLWNYYLALIQTGFIRVLQGESIIKKENILKWNLNMYNSLITNIPKSILGVTRYGETPERITISTIEVNGRIYKWTVEIYKKLLSLWEQDIFKVTFSDNTMLVCCKDLNYFYLLNLWLIDKVYLSEKELTLEQLDQIIFSPKLVNWRSFQTFINTFLEYEFEDYLNEYEDTKILEIISKNFSKNDIIKYTREYKTKIDKFEEMLGIAKLLPKSLYDE